jgi:diaminopimelate decarboxylase
LQDLSAATKRFRQIFRELGINLLGIHFHCGSGMNGADSFERAIKLAEQLIEIARGEGHEMKILDLGGGFPAGELKEGPLLQALRLTENNTLNYTVFAEPGRHVCAEAFHLVTRVLGKRIKR